MALALEIRKRLPNFTLEVSLSCEPGRLLALVGPSGAGKTTLVRVVAGLERPDAGRIVFDGEAWCDTEAGVWVPAQRRGLGYVFQEYTLFPHLNVEKNVAFAARRKRRVFEVLDLLGIAHLARRRPWEISGGERQRVALAQALARDPKALLLDEPFSALDIATRRRLQEELKALKAKLNLPILHVTHDLQEASLLADEIVAIEGGRKSPQWLDRFLIHAGPRAQAPGAASRPERRTLPWTT